MHKDKLLQQLKEVETQILALETNSISQNHLPESSELATASWEASVHNAQAAVKNNLKNMGKSLNKALLKIKEGTYGVCEKCKHAIDPQRLEVFPLALTCATCF